MTGDYSVIFSLQRSARSVKIRKIESKHRFSPPPVLLEGRAAFLPLTRPVNRVGVGDG